MDYDPTQFVGTAPYYLRGRPPYSRELARVLRAELGLDGTGQLVDVGCGPGTLGVQLSTLFGGVTFVDPDTEMLDQARSYAARAGVTHAEFLNVTGEELAGVTLPPVRVAVFGQSFHRMNRHQVAENVYDRLEPGGSMVLITHDSSRPPPPQPAGTVPIPHDDIRDLIQRFLGPELRSGSRPASSYDDERFELSLARTRFGSSRVVYARGRSDIVQEADGVIANYLSMSYSAPHLFGARLGEFVAEVRGVLHQRSPAGRFWCWPGDTELVISDKR